MAAKKTVTSTASTPDTKTNSVESDKVNQADSKATTMLKQKYREEFIKAKIEFAQELGVEWAPRPTKQERARAEIQRMLDEDPSLRDVFAPQVEFPDLEFAGDDDEGGEPTV